MKDEPLFFRKQRPFSIHFVYTKRYFYILIEIQQMIILSKAILNATIYNDKKDLRKTYS